MSIQLMGLIIAAIAFVVFAGVIIYKTGRIDGNPEGELNEWLGVADNEGD